MDLSKFLGRSIQAQMAGAGGYSDKTGLLDYLGDAAMALGAVRGSGLIGGLGVLANRRNQRQFNRAMYDQAKQDYKLRQEKQQAELERLAAERGDRQNIGAQFGLQGYTGAAELPDAATLGRLGEIYGNQDINQLLSGEALRVGPYSKIPTELILDTLGRFSKVVDTAETQNLQPKYLGPLVPGQAAASPQQAGQAMMEADPTLAPQNQAMMEADPTLAPQNQGVMAGGVAKDNLFDQNPYGLPVPDLDYLRELRQGEQDYETTGRKLTEEERRNKANEAIDWHRAQSARISANKPSGGSAGVPADAKISEMFNKDIDNQVDDINKEMKLMFGTNKNGSIKMPKDTAGKLRYQTLMAKKQALQSERLSISGGSAKADSGSKQAKNGQPFKGASKAKLSAAQERLIERYGGQGR